MGLALQDNLEEFLADANLFMELTSNQVLAWQWLKQGVIAVEELKKNPTLLFLPARFKLSGIISPMNYQSIRD